MNYAAKFKDKIDRTDENVRQITEAIEGSFPGLVKVIAGPNNSQLHIETEEGLIHDQLQNLLRTMDKISWSPDAGFKIAAKAESSTHVV